MALCGAKGRSGQPCRKHAVPGKKRCVLHGGKSKNGGAPKGSQNHKKPGTLYSQFLSSEERVIAVDLELGSIDEELRLMRIRLMRALKLEQDNPELEIDSRTERDVAENVGARSEVTFKKRDYVSIIDRITARIESLESRRESIIGARLDNELKRRELAKIDNENAIIGQGQVTKIEVEVVTCAPSK